MIIAVDAASTIFLSYTVQYYPYYYFISADRSSTWTDNSGRFGGTNPTRSRMSFTATRRVAGGVSITLHQLAKGVECSGDQVTEIQVNLLSQQGQYVAIP